MAMDLSELVKKHDELQRVCNSFHPEIKCWIRSMEGQASVVPDADGDFPDATYGCGAVGVIIRLPMELERDEEKGRIRRLSAELERFDYVVEVCMEVGGRGGHEYMEVAPGVLWRSDKPTGI